MFSQKSSSGKKARSPRWWCSFVDSLPKARILGLQPKTWDRETAESWVKRIPPKCPFERQLWWNDTLVLFIPALCPLNPFSMQLYEIRISAQSYLSSLDASRKSVL
jgi:hypothetical protein